MHVISAKPVVDLSSSQGMATRPQVSVRLAFGPYEVKKETGELLRSGIRVHLSGQPFQILLELLEHPGDVVSRDQLRTRIWGEDTFVDFERGLNAAINKLRRALRDSAENPRYVETVPGRGYRFIGTLERDRIAAPPAPDLAVTSAERPRTPAAKRWWWLASFAACLGSFTIGWRFHQPATHSPPWKLTRLTADSGFTDSPAISRDSKFVAYSSDRAQAGDRDLYIQQVAEGTPVRLTFDGAGNTTPDFSPDGTRIVFRSSRAGGGIYIMPALGGEARLLAKDGWNPKFSPDGSQVAYWTGPPGVAITVPGSGAVWVIPADGGQPHRVATEFSNVRFPIWSPDGTHLLVVGYASSQVNNPVALDWWLTPVSGGRSIRTDAYAAFVRQGLLNANSLGNHSSVVPFASFPRLNCWLRPNNRVVFSALSGAWNLWETGISPGTAKISGEFQRLSAGSGNEVEAACASADSFALTNLEVRRNLWSLPFDYQRGKPRAAISPVTEGAGWRDYPSISRNERSAAFASDQSGRFNIWLRDLPTGKETRLASSSFVQRFPLIAPSSERVAFASFENGRRFIYVAAPGEPAERLCEGCLQPTDWSHDEKSLLIFGGNPYQVSALDVSSRRQTVLVRHSDENVLYGRFSPDNLWISFTVRTGIDRGRILIAPLSGPKPLPESAWIKISDERSEDWANWSPDGKALYFTSARDGHICLWGQRIDSKTHRPSGEAFLVQHLHGQSFYARNGWSASPRQFTIVLEEGTGNIWTMSRDPASQ
jgi:eukaryotic-like serine/threonine-protein kinase